MITAADFRAMREGLGLSQADVAKAMMVNAQTVKRWENGRYPVPDDAWRWLKRVKQSSDCAVNDAFSSLVESGASGTVHVTYYRTQDEFDAFGRDVGFFGVANANSRKVAELLERRGIRCEFHYPGESAVVEVAKIVTR